MAKQKEHFNTLSQYSLDGVGRYDCLSTVHGWQLYPANKETVGVYLIYCGSVRVLTPDGWKPVQIHPSQFGRARMITMGEKADLP
jgi:hypothetical protein